MKKNILIFAPHADDAEIGMGGTICYLINKGYRVTICTVITPIENVSGLTDDYMKRNREKEQIKSAKLLSCDVIFMNLDPYKFVYNRDNVKKFDKIIKKINPVCTFSTFFGDTHQDHQTLSKILFSSLRRNDVSLLMYESMIPGGISNYNFKPHLYVDISRYIKKKYQSIKCYKSVFGYKKNNYSNYFGTIKARARYRGGIINTKYAEAFQVIKMINFI